ncbi:hypothetical protein [Rhizobium sp. Root1204]|uniref:hypothetical protein n=1 Tax=Rhizobium sp. Root1204 TaxID=1736428 RepID=UPI000ABBF45E|nr:hypothetical protein [Rhizobium sp. Root1204]
MSFCTLTILATPETVMRLRVIAIELGRDVEELAETSVAEAALEYFRGRKDDPAKGGEA